MSDLTDPERVLALSYARAPDRAALAALLALDETLGQILRTTREPLVGQMRLTWWHEALGALDTEPPPAQPVLQALAAEVLPRGVSGARLAGMIDGWEALLDPDPLDAVGLATYSEGRGATLFELAGHAIGAGGGEPLRAAGAGWALADFARHARDAGETDKARAAALTLLAGARVAAMESSDAGARRVGIDSGIRSRRRTCRRSEARRAAGVAPADRTLGFRLAD